MKIRRWILSGGRRNLRHYRKRDLSAMSRAPKLLIGDWTVDPSTGQAFRGGRSVHLTPRAVDLLRVLADHPGEVISIDELMDEVWVDVSVNTEVLYSVVAAIRRAFGDDPKRPRYVETIPKRGYRLVADVRHEIEQQPGEAGLAIDRPPPVSETVGTSAAIAMVTLLVTAITVWMLMSADRHSADEQQGVLHLALLSAESQSPGDGDQLQLISDRLAERIVRLEGVEIVTANVPVHGGEDFASYSATGRALGADAVLVVKADRSGRTFLDVVDPGSEELRASIAAEIDSPDASVVTHILVAKLAEEFKVAWNSGDELNVPDAARLGAREQEALGRFYLQGRFAGPAIALPAMDRSIGAFRAAVDLDPEFLAAWEGLSLALTLRFPREPDQSLRDRFYGQAREAIQQTLALDPNSADAYAAIGLMHGYDDDLTMARAALERSRDLDPENPATLRWSSRLLRELGEFHLAASHARRAAELAPFSIEVLADAALAAAMIGNCDLTIQLMSAALDLAPADSDALNNLIVVYRDCGHLDKAINLGPRLDRTIYRETDPRHTWQHLPGMMANLYVQIDAPAGAEVLIRQSEREFADEMYTYWARSSYLLATGDTDTARAHILTWPVEQDNPLEAALVAGHAIMVGLHAYARKLLDAVPEDSDPMESANPFLNRGRWLTIDQLSNAALSAVYMAYAERNAGESAAADALLVESMEFLDYWIERNVAAPNALYFRAAVHGLQGRPDDGIADLAAAIDAGFRYAWRIRIDPVLDGLRRHPDFTAVLRTLEDELAIQRARIDVQPENVAGTGPR